jgi:hypothetical protein
MGPLGPVRAAGALFVAGRLPPPLPALVAELLSAALLALDEALTAGAGELSAWLVARGV